MAQKRTYSEIVEDCKTLGKEVVAFWRENDAKRRRLIDERAEHHRSIKERGDRLQSEREAHPDHARHLQESLAKRTLGPFFMEQWSDLAYLDIQMQKERTYTDPNPIRTLIVVGMEFADGTACLLKGAVDGHDWHWIFLEDLCAGDRPPDHRDLWNRAKEKNDGDYPGAIAALWECITCDPHLIDGRQIDLYESCGLEDFQTLLDNALASAHALWEEKRKAAKDDVIVIPDKEPAKA